MVSGTPLPLPRDTPADLAKLNVLLLQKDPTMLPCRVHMTRSLAAVTSSTWLRAVPPVLNAAGLQVWDTPCARYVPFVAV